jgi:hypothetical protein
MILQHENREHEYEIICDYCKKPMFDCNDIHWQMSEYDQTSLYFPVKCLGCMKESNRKRREG